MLTNTKSLFSSILKVCAADCVCDIGSRDGDQSLLFRDLRPEAAVLAFEANPINFRKMQAREQLRERRIELFPFAISNQKGTATFHVTDVDHSGPAETVGTSSLLVREGLKIRESITVETRRIDDFILERHPKARRIALWIDVEGAEYFVLEGIEKIKDRVVALHVETAVSLMRQGQRTLAEVRPLLESYGFAVCGSNITPGSIWGDVVFLNRSALKDIGWRFHVCKWKGFLGYHLRADKVAVFLKGRFPAVYRWSRQAYLRLGT